MIKNFLKTTLRVLYQNKGFTAINILGLALGIACCIFIALYINHEVSFDRFHKNSHSIYRLTVSFIRNNKLEEKSAITSPKMGEDIMDAIPEVEKILRIGNTSGEFKYNNKTVSTGQLFYADSTLWQILDFTLIKGNPKTALSDPFSIVLSESKAYTFFGSKNPIGQIIYKNGVTPYTVTGVIQDCPTNTRMKYNGFVSFTTLYNIQTGIMTEWDGNLSIITLLLLNPGSNPEEVSRKINTLADEGINKKMAPYNYRFEMDIQPLRDIHLYSDLNYDKPGVAKILYIVSAIALFLLFIAGFNFVNLTTARSTRRAKEVGMRMTVGASKGLIRWQFIGESIILAGVSALLSLLLVEMLMPWYNNLLGLKLSLYNKESAIIGFSIPFFVVLFGLLAGLYPAFFLSSFKPIRVLKADFGGVKSKPIIRNTLVTIQFTVSSVLIIATSVLFLQLNHLKNKELGLNTNNLLVAAVNGDKMWQRAEIIKEALKEIPEVEDLAISTDVPGNGFTQNGYKVEGVEDHIMIRALGIDYDYIKIIGARIKLGRNLSQLFPSDENAVLVNETLVKKAGWTDPIGKKIVREKEFTVVGVVEDFHYMSLHTEIEPLVMFLPFDYFFMWSPRLHIRIKDGMLGEGIEKIRAKWENIEEISSFNHSLVQDIFNNQYKTEDNFSTLFIFFSILAVFISCLGLLGLSSFMLENRRREIGIRKVMGSSIGAIIAKFSVDFTRWAILGTVISWPIAYYSLNELLNFYAYRIEMPWMIYILAAILTISVSLATILLQTYKAAKTNPVDTLKYE